MSPNVRSLLAFSLVGLTLAGGLLAGATTSQAAWGKGRDPYLTLDVLARVLTHIERSYVEPADPDALVHNAISGMVGSLDPHSVYLNPDAWAKIQAGDEDPLASLGLAVGEPRADGALPIHEVTPAGPAARAGVQVGDALIRVDDVDVRRWTPADVAYQLQGPAGEPVRLKLLRGTGEVEAVALREKVITPAVTSALFSSGWGYVHILHFRARVHAELERALVGLQREAPLRGLVLDLRDNPGGVLEEAIAVADLFVGEGLLVETRGREAAENHRHEATPAPTDLSFPLVILVNQGSASASELVAGALQDLGRATLVGTRTYGKGSVQSVYTFEDGSALKLTVARYYLAGGETPDQRGVTPDVVVEVPSDGPAQRLRARIETLPLQPSERAALLSDLDALPAAGAPAAVPWTGTLDERMAQDPQLATAWRTLRGARE